jgi:hypothetical protein
MSRLLLFDHRFIRHPVELNGATGPFVGLVPMPRIVRPAKDEKRAVARRKFGHIVLKVCAAPQQAKAAAGGVPSFVEIEKHRDDFCLAVCVDRSIFLLHESAHRAHGRSLSEIDRKLLFHSFAELGALQLLKQSRKMSFDLERVRRMRTGAWHRRKVHANFVKSVGGHAIGDDDVIERLLFETRPRNSIIGEILHRLLHCPGTRQHALSTLHLPYTCLTPAVYLPYTSEMQSHASASPTGQNTGHAPRCRTCRRRRSRV